MFSFTMGHFEITVHTVRDQYNDYSVVYDVHATAVRIDGSRYAFDWTTSTDVEADVISQFMALEGGPRVYDYQARKFVFFASIC